MVSICIPIYNTSINNLAVTLYPQLSGIANSELIFCDDGSATEIKKENRRIAKQYDKITIVENQHNLGRSKTRNKLSQLAKNDWLIFLDGDMLPNSNFVANYIKNFGKTHCVVGGISYSSSPPSNKSKLLRWKHGVSREMKTADMRNQNPFASFMTGNFAIKKNVLLKLPFNEEISKYGHEDTLLGLSLKHHHFTITHINNPAQHLGIDTASEFIQKTEQAIQNLALVKKYIRANNWNENDIKLLRVSNQLKSWRGNYVYNIFFNLTKHQMLNNLKGNNPNLTIFDMYKLGIHLKNH